LGSQQAAQAVWLHISTGLQISLASEGEEALCASLAGRDGKEITWLAKLASGSLSRQQISTTSTETGLNHQMKTASKRSTHCAMQCGTLSRLSSLRLAPQALDLFESGCKH
jgi:hypothetical protein